MIYLLHLICHGSHIWLVLVWLGINFKGDPIKFHLYIVGTEKSYFTIRPETLTARIGGFMFGVRQKYPEQMFCVIGHMA